MTIQTKELNDMVIVHLDNVCWTGRKKLNRSELLRVSDADLPPETLTSLGHKKIFDPSALTPFGSLRKKMERRCEDAGVRFLGGYAIPQSEFDALALDLDSMVQDAENLKTKFLAEYEKTCAEWIAEHEGWGDSLIRNALVPRAEAATRIRFGWNAIKLAPAAPSHSSEAETHEMVTLSLREQVLNDVCARAGKVLNRLDENVETTQSGLESVRKLQSKIESLKFLDHGFQPVIDEIQGVLSEMPKTGKIVGTPYKVLTGLMRLLASRTAITEFMAAAASRPKGPSKSDDVIDDKTTTAEPESVAQTESAPAQPQPPKPTEQTPLRRPGRGNWSL